MENKKYYKNKRTCETTESVETAAKWLDANEYDVIEIWSFSEFLGEWLCVAEWTFKGDI